MLERSWDDRYTQEEQRRRRKKIKTKKVVRRVKSTEREWREEWETIPDEDTVE
jgi:hypothetical protein